MKNKSNKDYSHIKGWAIDADPKNDPVYPMKNRTNGEHKGYNWKRPKQQAVDREVLHSNERPNVSAVFGLAPEPSGLSGMIRRFAFKYSENEHTHWLSLLFADRVNELEGLVDDIKKGQFPNIIAEKGWGAQWKHDRKTMIKKITVGTAIVAGIAIMLSGKRNKYF
ncbi:hypothetical protein JKA74_03240 [Marivirga sp. S37H4]|uniref:Uncharacterized protein n=1 Tax=Marivirga aurantiaca TaxID=2802615 RepID=A0A935C5W5_9BACT|nr:hypothetical protein [Marivirga aurantiaca]MBK6264040.1 hypothetical protein [Marivirga aurantiaca]